MGRYNGVARVIGSVDFGKAVNRRWDKKMKSWMVEDTICR